MENNDPTSRDPWIQRLWARYKDRPDTEHEQSLVRVAIVLLVLIYLGGLDLFGNPSESAHHGLIILCIFLLFSLVMIAAIAVNPAASISRRIVCMLGDMGMITYLLYYYGETMTPLYIVYLWVSSGYGLRYGNRYLAASTAMAAFGFFLVLKYNAYWQANATMGWGLWIGLIVLPMYIASLLAKLSRALNAAEAANQAKSRFLANMSHEIRTPINGVIGLQELLGAMPLTDKQRSILHGAQSSAATLLHIIENVLDISKIESGRLTVSHERFDLHALINSVVGMFDYVAGSKHLKLIRRIDPDCPYWLSGDEFHLRQVLVNLIGNAVKFTQEGSVTVRVTADGVKAGEAELLIEVIDTGIGISEQAQARIFEPFRQEDERITRRFGGTGLGMSIAKQLTEQMGGSLGVSSMAGHGSTFRLKLPCELAGEPEQRAPLSFPSGVRVISEDSHLIGRLRSWFDDWGVMCAFGSGVTPGVSEAVILLDVRTLAQASTLLSDYPGLSGHDLVLLNETPLDFDIETAGYSASLYLPLSPERLHTVMHSFQPATFNKGMGSMERDGPLPRAFRTGHILIADDNRINREVTRSFLEQVGHTVTVVQDGNAALGALETQQFDLAIMDMMMPGHGGLDVIKLYRHLAGSRDLPFIVLTANVREEVRTACEALGVKYLSKPLRGSTLQAVAQEMMMHAGSATSASATVPEGRAAVTTGEKLIDEMTFQDLVRLLGQGSHSSTLVTDFCHNAEHLLHEMARAVKQAQWLRVGDLAHGLKGAALGIGAEQLAKEARHLEQHVRQGMHSLSTDPLAPVQTAYQTVRRELKARTAQASDSGRPL